MGLLHLVFRLQGNWCFDVVIFDLSATEIDYPMKLKVLHRLHKDHDRGVDRRVPVQVPKSENEDDDEDDQEMEMERKGEKDQEVAYSKEKMKKMKRKNMERSTAHQRFNDEEDEDLGIDYSKRPCNLEGSASNYGEDGRSGPVSMKPGHPRRTPQPLTKNQERVLKVATSFKLSTKNPSFMVTMRPSYIQTGNYLSLPKNFAKRYLKESIDVTLELANGRIWSVSCGVRWAFTRLRTEFKDGWKRFAVDNELQEGDICIFELMNKIPKVKFRVTIFRLPPN